MRENIIFVESTGTARKITQQFIHSFNFFGIGRQCAFFSMYDFFSGAMTLTDRYCYDLFFLRNFCLLCFLWYFDKNNSLLF